MHKLVYAVELMRYLDGSGMTNEDFQGACDMFKRCFIPVLDDFFSITEPKNKAVGNFGASALTVTWPWRLYWMIWKCIRKL